MIKHKDLADPNRREVIIFGGGIAGLSAAIYLGRAERDTLVIYHSFTSSAHRSAISTTSRCARSRFSRTC
jgi:thioredoxin reductase